MLLTVDIGNSYITIAGFERDGGYKEMAFKSTLVTERRRTEDEYACQLMQVFALNKLEAESVSDAVICSVVPELTKVISYALKRLTGAASLVVGPGVKTGVDVALDDPAQLGSDLIAEAVAAKKLFGCPCIIFDLGTATTVSVLDSKGKFRGGMICAGISISLESLASSTSLLPHVSMDRPKSVIGRNTTQCMQSGVIFGTAAMIDGIIERIEGELGERATSVITGNYAEVIAGECQRDVSVEGNLTMYGLREVFLRNKK